MHDTSFFSSLFPSIDGVDLGKGPDVSWGIFFAQATVGSLLRILWLPLGVWLLRQGHLNGKSPVCPRTTSHLMTPNFYIWLEEIRVILGLTNQPTNPSEIRGLLRKSTDSPGRFCKTGHFAMLKASYLRLTGSAFVPVKNVVFLTLRTFTRLSISNLRSWPLSTISA